MLGIFIGVAAVIAMVAVGDGATRAVEAQIAEPGHQSARRAARRDHVQRRARRVRQQLDADRERRRGDPKEARPVAAVSYIDRQVAQVECGTATGAPASTARRPATSPIRDWPVVAGRPLHRRGERAAPPGMPARADRGEQSVRRGRKPGRRDGPGEELPDAVVGVLAVKGQSRLRPGPGRRGADAV